MYSPKPKAQICFAGPINKKKDYETYILTCIDRFSNIIPQKFLIAQMH